MKRTMNWTNRKFILIGVLLVVLINEFTLQIFDKTPPLSDKTTLAARFLDLLIIFFAFTAKCTILNWKNSLRKISSLTLNYLMPTIIVVILVDISLSLFGFGYPSHYKNENLQRFPYPSDIFRGKPNTLDHNEFGFRGDFISSKDSFNVAIFGGSTTYLGNPPIIEIVRDQLLKQNININVFNFGSISSNHSQHTHRLLDFSDRINLDLVIFYGGWNEVVNYTNYDSRPGYPYNFFYRNELDPLLQSLIRYSSIIGTIDKLTNGSISGLKSIRESTILSDPEWSNKIILNYWRDLTIANNITTKIIKPSYCKKTNFISIIQPGKVPQRAMEAWEKLLESGNSEYHSWKHVDLSIMKDKVEFSDLSHLVQTSRKIMAVEFSKIIKKTFFENCR